MNKVIITGRITNDLELKQTTTNKYVCEFNIASNRFVNSDGEQVTDFVRCVVWKKQAESLVKYQKKGNLIAVIGRLQVDAFTDKDGNYRYKTYVQVEELEFLEPKKKDTPANDNFDKVDAPKDMQFNDEELPFETGEEDLPY